MYNKYLCELCKMECNDYCFLIGQFTQAISMSYYIMLVYITHKLYVLTNQNLSRYEFGIYNLAYSLYILPNIQVRIISKS